MKKERLERIQPLVQTTENKLLLEAPFWFTDDGFEATNGEVAQHAAGAHRVLSQEPPRYQASARCLAVSE